MILPVSVNLKEIEEKGRDFPWNRPEECLRCHGRRLWGHGFVTAIFDGFKGCLLLRRYRCPFCGCVIRLRPEGYFKRFQASKRVIRFHIVTRFHTGKWVPGFSSARGRHWLRGLKRQVMAHLGMQWMSDLLKAFDLLREMGNIPVSRRI